MNDNAKQWAAALRSDRFKQGTGALHIVRHPDAPDELCCLGVACVLAYEAGVSVTRKPTPDGSAIAYDGDSGTLPPVVQEWLGLQSPDGLYFEGFEANSLASRNDYGAPFAEIADIIEGEPKGLFA